MATRQYIGARYVPKFADPIAWVKENSYEALTIVTYLNNSYTSKKPVPANTEITDTDYWVVTGNYNAQVEKYREETVAYREETLAYKEAVDGIKTYSTIEEFGAKGDGETDDTTAITNALAYGKSNNVCITTKGKTYKITSNIDIDATVFNLNGATISGNYVINIKNGGRLTNGVVNSSIVLGTGKNNLDYVTIKEWNGTAIKLDTGCYECFVHHIRLENNSATETVGIEFNANDCTASYIYGYGAKTGIINNGNDNFADNVHLWLNANNSFTSSVFLKLKQGLFTISNSCSDSYETFLNQTRTALNCNFNNCYFINNNTLFKNKTFYGFVGGNDLFLTGNVIFELNNFSDNGNTVTLGNCKNINITALDGDFSDKHIYYGAYVKSLVSASCTTDDNIFAECNGGVFKTYLPLWFEGSTPSSFTVDFSTLEGISDKKASGIGIANAGGGGTVIVSYVLLNGTLTVTSTDNAKTIRSLKLSVIA